MNIFRLASSHRLFIIIILLSVLSPIAIFGAWRYNQSNIYVAEADQLVKSGKAEEAIITYLKAHELFPFRSDVYENLKGARLLVESDALYGSIYGIGIEIQEAPQIPAEIAKAPLKPGQLHVPLLMYHHIRINPRPGDPVWAALNVTPQQLDDQLAYLMNHNFHAITLDDLLAALDGQAELPSNPIILTFDDGYSTFYSNAFPLLKKYNVKAVAFVITNVQKASAYMSWDQITEIDRSGLVQFAAHTRNHPDLTVLSSALVTSELNGSKGDLESHLKKPIRWFAYPYGSYNNSVTDAVKKAGFVGAASTIYGVIQSKDTIYLMPRIMIDGRYSLDNFAKRISY